ncbi:MAG: thiamine-phosphate kinase [Bacteroidaceae bacterium]|nr:thiamine-phosphate kinase [Bacteroidaceae bacterium]MBR5891456.1 thiamine-phosphate kinase [Bacteroidaceae bacterium]
MNEINRTEISTIGEFGLIEHLTSDITPVNQETKLGVGDDAAILQFNDDEEVLVSTDMLMEGIHFDLTYVPLKHLGYKSAIVNFSDIYAMNGTPKQITVSIALGKRFCIEDMEDFYAGLKLACERHNVDIVGGDTTSSLTGLAISITVIGTAPKGKSVKRSGAKTTDLICVSGDLGAAYMGLQLLEREKIATMDQEGVQPDFAGKEYLLERQLKPEARRDIIERLREANVTPTAMMDISDGLSSELLHICKQSKVGCRIYEDKIPVDYQTAIMAEELNLNVITCALNGGEDYELLFTVPIADHEKVASMKDVRLVGHIVKEELGAALITRDGVEMELKAQGWNPMKSK